MFKTFIAAMTLFTAQAFANTSVFDTVQHITQQTILGQAETQGLNWKVGDTNNYVIDMGFLKGTMSMSVREIGADGIWLDQKVDMGFAGKQDVQTLLDPNTGAVKKMIVNGQEQAPPKQNVELIDTTEDRITVPAGTYDAIHARLKDKDNNQEINIWVNPQQIPISGMLKTIQPSQMGNVTVLLKSFKKN